MRKTRLCLVFLYVLVLSPVLQTFLFTFPSASAAPLDNLQLSSLSATPSPFSPNNDGRLDVVKISSVLNIEGTGQTAQAVLKSELAVKDSSGKQVASLAVGKQLLLDIGKWNATVLSAEWDGKTRSGELAADGTYFYTVDLSLLKGCKGNGDNRDDLHSGNGDLLGDCNSGEGNDSKGERIITTSGPYFGEISIDNTPPTITIEGAENGEFSNKDVTPTISISDQHMASQSIFLNEQPFLSGTHVKEEGHHALSIIAEDRAANVAKINLEFTIDKTPPTVNIVSPAEGSQVDISTPQISFEYSDSLSGIDVLTIILTVDNVRVTSDAQITETGITYSPLSPLQEGQHTIDISVSDISGNMTEVSTTFTLRSGCQSVIPVPFSNNKSTTPFVFPEPGAGNMTANIEVADINRDGYLDIIGASNVVTDLWGNSKSWISLLLGKGGGEFEEFGSFAEKDNSSYISQISLGDFNNDCYPDLAVTRRWPDELYIFINDGDGNFIEKAVSGIGGRSALLTGRFDEDRYEDIIVYNSAGKVTSYKGNGDGTFATPVNLTIHSGYSNIIDMVTLDLNEDGIKDIAAVMGESDSSNASFLGREIVLLTGSGQGDFTQTQLYTVADNSSIGKIIAGDFNGDSHEDITVLKPPDYQDTNTGNIDLNLITFLGNGSGWLSNGSDNIVWAENLILTDYEYDNAIALDINGDKYVDVAISSNGKLYSYISNGDGSFHYSNAYNVINSFWINSGDFDGDGDKDIVTAGAFILSNRGDGTFIDWKNIYSPGINQIASADFDGDKRPDLVTTAGLFSSILNKNDDWLEDSFQNSHSTSYNIIGGPRSLKIKDLDHDGHLDVVTANKASGTVAVLRNNGDGSLKAPVYYQTGQQPGHVVLEDLNGDSHLDIITANEGSGDISVFLGRGDGTFQGQKSYAAGSVPGGLAIGDFNRDGRPDLAVTNTSWGSNEVSILFGRGDGTFGTRVVNQVSGTRPRTIKEGDYNNDGIPDLAVLYQSSFGWWGITHAIDLLLGKGDGTFLTTKSAVNGGKPIEDFISDDLSRDGVLDIVIFDSNSGETSVFINNGNGRFTQNQLFGASWPAVSGDINNDGRTDLLCNLTPWLGQGNGTFEKGGSSVGEKYVLALDLGDIDGDGIMDIVAVEDGLKLSVILGTGGGSFQGETVVHESEMYAGVNLATGDFNGDGNQDVAVSEYSKSEDKSRIVLYWGSGYNTFSKGTIIETYYSGTKIFAADLNGDGKTDIAHYVGNKYEVTVFLNNGDGSFQGALKYSIESNRSDIKLEDVNGDGYPDIINDVQIGMWGTSSYGVSIHAGNGDGTFRHFQTLPFGEREGNWAVHSQIGDLNNDGHPDLAVGFSHYLHGAEPLKIYLNNGNGFDADAANVTDISINGGRFAGDFNNDGNIDLVVTDGTLSLYSGNGDGTFSSAVRYGTEPEAYNSIVRDFNLDGRLDLAVRTYHGLNLLYNTLPPLLTPPSPPAALKGLAGDATVILSWAANGEEDVNGYNVYRSLSAGGGYEKINGAPLTFPVYTDDTVTNGMTYYYTVSALDNDGEESSYAVKVRAVPHAPDTTPPVVSFSSPVNYQTVTNPALFVSGTINEADARVTVNGRPGVVQKNSGTFTAYDIPLQVGENTLTVTAVDPVGNTASSSVKVIYTHTAMIEGILRDELTGIAVPNAWIYVRDAMKEQAFLTKPDGTFTFLNVMPGEITITAYGGDYDTVKIDRTIAPEENLILDIPLPLYPALIRAWIYDSHTSNRVAMATITITDPKKTQTLTANDYGQFESSNISPYQITITISSAGYQTHMETVNVTNRWTNYLYFYLDPLPPSPPSGFTATPGKGFVNLAWNANSESNLATYQIYRSTTSGASYQLIASVAGDKHTYADGNIVIGTTYYYVVQTVNTSAQPSGYSAEAAAVSEALPAPTGLTATPGKGQVSLAWNSDAESMVSSYNIYRSTETGSGYTLIGSIAAATHSYTDGNVTAGMTYFYVVTAVNLWSRESGWSDENVAVPEAVGLRLTITAPGSGSYIATPSVVVKGMIESSSPEVGVTLDVEGYSKAGSQTARYLAEVNGRYFAAQVELFPSVPNTIRAVATLPDGEQITTAITLYPGGMDEPVKVTALPPSGVISPQTGSFEITFEAEVNTAGTIVNYAWDFDGDGRVDKITNTPATSFGYSTPGIFYPTVTVTVDTGSGVPTREPVKGIANLATTVVNVMSYEEMDAQLKTQWGGMKQALATGDIEGAMSFFSDASQEKYRGLFTYLRDELPEMAGEMNKIQLIYLRDGRAKYRIRRMEERQEITYYIYFHRLSDGLWKIHQF